MPKREPKRPRDPANLDLLIRAKEANRPLLRSKPYVIGMNIGYRIKGGRATDERVVTVYVARKVDPSRLAKEDLIPKTIKIGTQEVPVDVVEGQIPNPSIFTIRSRPLRGGSSIGLVTGFASGTGGVCVTLNDRNTYILSCNHVIAGENLTPIGTRIVQPSLGDGGNATNDAVATLSDFIPLDFGTTTITLPIPPFITVTFPNPNFVDAAIAQVINPNQFNVGNREIHWIGYPQMLLPQSGGWNWPQITSLLGRRVCKMGRTTEFTIGTISSLWLDTFVGPYDTGQRAWFEDQVQIIGANGPFSRRGDSGSLIVDFETREPIGLLFAGMLDGSFTLANPIHEVLNRLQIPQI